MHEECEYLCCHGTKQLRKKLREAVHSMHIDSKSNAVSAEYTMRLNWYKMCKRAKFRIEDEHLIKLVIALYASAAVAYARVFGV